MFKENKKYIFFLTLCFSALVLLQVFTPEPIDWKLSYAKKHKTPFGTSALYSILPDIFPEQNISQTSLPIYNTLKNSHYTNHNYIIINDAFEPDTLDTRELLKFVSEGNTLFIAANYFSGKFADSLKISTTNYFGFNNFNPDSTLFSGYNLHDTVKVNYLNPGLKRKQFYSFSKGVEGTYFNSFDTTITKVLGEDEKNNINFIKISLGKGTMFINTLPETFSNYHFTTGNHSYVYEALSCLPVQTTIWDEYYKAGNVINDSPLRVIFKTPLLLKAYYLLILSLILFMIFGAKRKQRIIPVVEPYPNTTLQFVDIVGTLYYQTGNHKNIADKKITYFLEYIRTSFQTKTTMYDEAFISRISNLSGIEYEQVHQLFYYFSDISIRQNITQEELLKLNRMIENFHKQSKR